MQIPLIELPSPLDGTVGREFFSELPKVPGIYRMYGDQNELLYVGKAKDLRTRLMSYRRVKLGKSSSKSLRLVHSVSKIEIEKCDSEQQALIRENELLRSHKPPFNVVNTRPEKYFYFVVNVRGKIQGGGSFHEEKIQASIEMTLTNSVEGAIYGAYKGLALCQRTFFALRRVLWTFNQSPGEESFRYPLELFRKQKLAAHEFEISRADLNLLAGYLHGFIASPTDEEPELIARARHQFARFDADPFHRNWFEEDLETLTHFFKTGPLRNRRIKAHSTEDSPVIQQEQMDDLLVRERFKVIS